MFTGIEIGRKGLRPFPFDDLYESPNLYTVFLPLIDVTCVSSGSVKLTYLQQYITNYIARADMMDAVTRAFLLYLFGSTFFSNQKGTVRLGYLASLARLDQLHTIDWGTAILGTLYTALDSFALGDVRQMYAFWYILPLWYYEYTANMHHRIQDSASQAAEHYFPRMRRWETMQYVHHVPLGVRHDLMEARSQLDMRSRGNIMRTPWASHWTHLADAGLLVDDHPLMVVYSLSTRRAALHTPAFMPMWYLGERCAYQITGDRRIPYDPLSCEDMFGRHRVIGD